MSKVKSMMTIKPEVISTLVMQIETTDLKILPSSLKKDSHPKHFQYVIIDMTLVKSLESPAWFRELRSILRQHNFILLGVRQPQLNLEYCKSLKIPVIDHSNLSANDVAKSTAIKHDVNTHIQKPVRSGQQVFAQSGGLIIANNISAGSEVAAIGDVHIYGSAHGKIIAGARGNENAKIYIMRGYPELISIAGITLYSEKIKQALNPTLFMINNGQIEQTLL